MKLNVKKLKKQLVKNKQLFIGLSIGALVASVGGLYIRQNAISNRSASQASPAQETGSSESQKIELDTAEPTNQSTGSGNSSQPAENQNSGSSSSSGSSNNIQKPTNTQPTVPAPKQPTGHTFFSGTITPDLRTNQSPNGYSVWGSYSPAFNESDYRTAKISWFIEQNADPSIEIQISYDGSTWISYKTSINSGNKTGSIIFDVPAKWIRIFMNNGSCVPGYCESPRPNWAQPYSATVSGYFSN